MLADPRHRQIGQHVLVLAQPLALDRVLRGDDEVVVAQHHALGLAGGAGGVKNDREIGAPTLGDLVGEKAGLRRGECAPLLLHRGVAVEEGLRIVSHAAPVAVEDRLEPGDAFLHREQLVDLFLVLGDGETHLGMVEDEGHLVGAGILVDRYRHAADSLGRRDRPIEAGPVVADDRQLVAALEAHRREAAGEIADLARDLAPGPALPDAIVLLAVGRLVAAPRRMIE